MSGGVMSNWNGRSWQVDLHNADESIWTFARRALGLDAGPPVTCVFNATPVPREGYAIVGHPCSLRLNLPPLGAMFFIGPA